LSALPTRLKNALAAMPPFAMGKIGILFCGGTILADFMISARRRVQGLATRTAKQKTPHKAVSFVLWCG